MKSLILFLSVLCFFAMTETAYADLGPAYTCPTERQIIQLQNKMHLLKSQYDYYQKQCAEIEESIAQLANDDIAASSQIESLQVCMKNVSTFQNKMLENLKAQKCRPVSGN